MADTALKRKTSPDNNIAMERHMIFVCPECGQTTDTQNEWRQHLNIVHEYAKKKAKDFDFKEVDRKYHECQICLKRLAHGHHSPVLLQYHRFSHLAYGGPFKCRYCAGTYVKKRALSVHLFRCHSQLMNKLDNEYKMEKMKQAIALRHPRFNREFYMRFICPQCGKLFQRCHEWLEHIDKAHPNTSGNLCMHRIICTRDYYCDQCSDTLKGGPKWDQLRRHHFSHLPYASYFQCAFCITQKSFKTDLFLHFIKYHRADYTKNKKYICAPDEWGGPAKEATLKQIELYTKDDKVLEEVLKNRAALEGRKNARADTLANTNGGGEDVCEAMDIQPLEDISKPQIQKRHVQKNYSQPQVNDILQKALHDSCIDLEEEEVKGDTANNPSLTTLDPPTVNTYENVFVVEMGGQKTEDHSAIQTKCVELNDTELEEICKEMFEEIPESQQNEEESLQTLKLDAATKYNKMTNDKNIDLQKREMQKYINYLCPECLLEFDKQPAWRSHVFEKHNITTAVRAKFRPLNNQKTAYLCLTCYQVQRTSKHVDLQRHYFQHMPHQGYLKCTLCKKTKSSKPKMLQHLQFVHRIQIPPPTMPTSTGDNDMNANKVQPSQCLECDLMFDNDLQNHLRECPARLVPLAVVQYDNIAKNMQLLEHLQKASQRIDKMLLEVGIDASTL